MQPLGLRETRFMYELKHEREHPVSEHLFWLRVEQKRRRAARLAALRARVLAPLAALRGSYEFRVASREVEVAGCE